MIKDRFFWTWDHSTSWALNTPGALKKLLSMPKSVFFQWKCDQRIRDGGWTENDRMIENLRPFRQIMRAYGHAMVGRPSYARR